MIKLLSAVVFLALSSLGVDSIFEYGSNDFPGCPSQMKYVSNLNFSQVQGVYFTHFFRTNSSYFNLYDGCCTIYYYLISPLEMGLVFCCSNNGVPICDNGFTAAVAYNEPECPGLITVSKGEASIVGFVIEADVDYSYIFVIDCGLFPDGSVYQNAFAFTRTPEKPPGLDEKFYRSLANNGFDVSQLAVPVFSGPSCSYNVPKCETYAQ